MEERRTELAQTMDAKLPREPRANDHRLRAGPKLGRFASYDFYFHYEFDKYDITDVADLFGLSHDDVEKLVVDAIKARAPDIRAMYDSGWPACRKEWFASWCWSDRRVW
jgi:hypothetical protein